MMEHAPAEMAMGDPDRLAYLVFTSGSSGEPKAVAHAHRAIWARRMMCEGWYGLTPGGPAAACGRVQLDLHAGHRPAGPLGHGRHGADPRARRPDGGAAAPDARHDATILAAAPGVFRKLLRGEADATPATPAPWAFGGARNCPNRSGDWRR
jgi:non-ribosomal peptide synthetase component F